ncbi:MAG: hypothetical protein ABID79_03740 [Elusimicrobiota bacterium]
MKIFTIVFYILFFAFSVVFAAHPLATDDIGIVEVGKYELEMGYDNCKREGELRNHSCGISLKHGITEKMDVGVSFPYQLEPKLVEPLGMATLGFKFLLIRDIFALTVNNELGSQEYFVNGIFTREIQPITIHANVGYAISGDENTEGEIIYSSAVEYPFSKIDIVGEIVAEKIGLQDWLFGVRYKVSEKSAIDFAYGNGFRSTEKKIVFGFHTGF